MWKRYFKLVKILPGRILNHRHGELDFSRDDISVETCKELYEANFPYLEITAEGEKELYGIAPVAEPEEPAPTYIDLQETVETEVSLPNRKKNAKRKSSE